KRTGGKKTEKMTAGSRINGGKPGNRLKARLPATRKISVGSPMRRAQGTAIVVKKRSSSVAVTKGISACGSLQLKDHVDRPYSSMSQRDRQSPTPADTAFSFASLFSGLVLANPLLPRQRAY